MDYRMGTCGWSYADWKGNFYPQGIKDELAYYATRFNTVEIDSTFYRIPSTQTVDSWRRRVPDDFIFCPKLLGEITHERQLQQVDHLTAVFLSVIEHLEGKLGPIVVQLAPKFTTEQFPLLEDFLRTLPTDLRFTIEFRHRSWLTEPRAQELLMALNMGLVMAHHPWYPRFEVATTDFAYLRLLGRHGALPDATQTHRPQDDALQKWANTVKALSTSHAFIFANNSFEGYSPATIERLRLLVFD